METDAPQYMHITTLVSVGQHPLSQRQRRADEDAKALEVMLRFAPTHAKVLHVGNADEGTQQILRDYLGMGLNEIELLHSSDVTDAALALQAYFTRVNSPLPDILLTGTRSETGEASGFLPYIIAEKLQMPIVPNICALLSVNKIDGCAEVLQSLPRGQRRKIRVTLPFVATVASAAPAPRQSSFATAMRGNINIHVLDDNPIDSIKADWKIEAARPRPKRLKMVKAKTAAQRFKAATAKVQGNQGSTIYDTNEAVTAILKLLKDEKVSQLSKK